MSKHLNSLNDITHYHQSSFSLTDFFYSPSIKSNYIQNVLIFSDLIYESINDDKIEKLFRFIEKGKILFIYSDKFYPVLNEPLCSFAFESLKVDNASGGSDVSEALSINHFNKIFSIEDCVYEMHVKYKFEYKMIDYLLTVKGEKDFNIGVSVTRAMNIKNEEDVENLLYKKLNGLIIARNCVLEKHSFSKSILHIWSENEEVTKLILNVVGSDKMSRFLKELDIAGTLSLWITTTNFDPIFSNYHFY